MVEIGGRGSSFLISHPVAEIWGIWGGRFRCCIGLARVAQRDVDESEEMIRHACPKELAVYSVPGTKSTSCWVQAPRGGPVPLLTPYSVLSVHIPGQGIC